MPPRPNRATIRYRSMRTVPGENPPLCGGCDLEGTGAGLAPCSKVGVSGTERDRPQEEHKWAFSEHNAPQPEQVIMRTDCIPRRHEVAKPYRPILRVSNITVEKSPTHTRFRLAFAFRIGYGLA